MHNQCKSYPRTSKESARKRALKVLKQHNISAKIQKCLGKDLVIYSGSSELSNGFEFTIQLKKPIPIPTDYAEVVNRPVVDHAFLAWKFDFSREQIESVLDDSKRMNYLLVKFLTGKTLIKEADRKAVKQIS